MQGIVVEVYTPELSFVVDDGTGTVTAVIPMVGLDGSPNAAAGDSASNWNSDSSADGLPEKGMYTCATIPKQQRWH